ncbi:hypothetical protein [Halobaculum rubrum]|uniref:hypothetical protein n=1 Tax=Halobaculum rubrum TaxID=2872158 RepID=UPI001CA3D55C|nr:hypothetical protein [Halobaculum rubrum]QZY01214.1 hypothetical protein K6T25_15250 [Halobaculum rubrum]
MPVSDTTTEGGSEGFELAIDGECAAPGCGEAPQKGNLDLLLGARVGGMDADYGEVSFCSVECLDKFVSLAPFREQYPETSEVTITAGEPVIAYVSAMAAASGPDEVADDAYIPVAGCNFERAHEAVAEQLSSEEFPISEADRDQVFVEYKHL